MKPKSITLKLTLDADDMPLHDLIHFICEELQIEFILEDDVLLVGDITKDAKHHLALYTMPEDLFEIIGAKKDKVYQKYFAEQGLQLSNRADLKVLNNFQIILVDGTLNDHKLFNKIIDDLDPTFIKTELDRVLERIIPKFRFSGTLTDAFIALVEETVQKNVEAPHLSIYQNFTIDKNHKVHLDLENIPVKEVISYICKTHNLHHQQDTHAIAISDLKANPQKSDSEKIRAMQQKIFELQEEVNQFKDGFQNIHQKIIQTAKRQHKPISKNLNVVIPKIRLNNRDLLFVVDFIRRKSRDLSDEGEGINIVLGKINTQKKVNIDLDDVPISELIRYICDQLDLKYTVEDYAVIIRQK